MQTIFPNPDGKYPSLFVADGQTVTISAKGAHKAGIPMLKVQPRTTAALMVLGGQSVDTAPRLSDETAFKPTHSTEGFVSFTTPDENGRIAGYSVSFLRGLLGALDSKSETLPTSVKRLIPQSPEDQPCDCVSKMRQSSTVTAALTRPANALQPDAPLQQGPYYIREISVPDFLIKFNVFSLFVRLGDIVVGRNATLILDSDITFAIANNVLAYNGARIVQRGGFLSLDVTGIMRGSLLNIFHKVTDVVSIDLNALAAEPATKP